MWEFSEALIVWYQCREIDCMCATVSAGYYRLHVYTVHSYCCMCDIILLWYCISVIAHVTLLLTCYLHDTSRHIIPFHYTKLYHITSHNGYTWKHHFTLINVHPLGEVGLVDLLEGGRETFGVAPLHVCMCMWLWACLHVHICIINVSAYVKLYATVLHTRYCRHVHSIACMLWHEHFNHLNSAQTSSVPYLVLLVVSQSQWRMCS